MDALEVDVVDVVDQFNTAQVALIARKSVLFELYA